MTIVSESWKHPVNRINQMYKFKWNFPGLVGNTTCSIIYFLNWHKLNIFKSAVPSLFFGGWIDLWHMLMLRYKIQWSAIIRSVYVDASSHLSNTWGKSEWTEQQFITQKVMLIKKVPCLNVVYSSSFSNACHVITNIWGRSPWNVNDMYDLKQSPAEK